jgi:23S rRNA pseudouridine1911/1915/1917 synthase
MNMIKDNEVLDEELMEDDEFEDLYEWQEFKADPRQEPIRIDKFLMDRLKDITRSKVQAGIEEGFVQVNGKVVKSNHKIKPHDLISVRLRKPRNDGKVVPEKMPLDIRYEDDDVMIIFKPAGLVVHPGVGNHSGTLVNALAWHFKELPIVEGTNEYPGVVHRIDKDTTGLMVIAKTDIAISKLAKQFFDHTIERRYRALVWGDFDEEEGTIEGHIGRHERNAKMFTVYEDGEYGKHAITHYRVIQRFGYVTLVECQLETGRTHQIRVHMKHIGHPLFNDKLYGGDKIVKGTIFTKYKEFIDNCFKLLPHQALHAFSLGFQHPTKDEKIYLEADMPEYFRATLDKWERYTEGRLSK